MPLPWPWILLDGAGALLFALGMAERVAGVPLLSTWVPMRGADLAAITLGGIIMAVAMLGVVRAVLARARSARAIDSTVR